MFNLVIKMEKGKIYEIVWDNGCFDCGKDKCIDNIKSKSIFDPTINKTYSNCIAHDIQIENKEEDNKNKTDNENTQENDKNKPEKQVEPEKNDNYLEPKFYITWFGTDKDKRQLKTAGLAMTKFKPYIIAGSFYSSIKGLFT